MARPAISAGLAGALLLAAAAPYIDLERGWAGIDTVPESDVLSAYRILAKDFSAGLLDPVEGALQFVDADKLVPSTNCGMAPLSREVALGKLSALSAGAEILRTEIATART